MFSFAFLKKISSEIITEFTGQLLLGVARFKKTSTRQGCGNMDVVILYQSDID